MTPPEPLPTFPPLLKAPPHKSYSKHKKTILEAAEQGGWNIEPSEEGESDEEAAESMTFVLQYFHEHPDLAALYTNPEATDRQCPVCNKQLGGTVFDVYIHAKTSRGKTMFLHRAVAQALRRLYDNDEPPRSSRQLPREQSRPNRRPAPTRR
jgi:hypothetical protein